MIKINLLPFRAARKKENIRKEISIYLLSLVLLIVVMVYLNVSSTSRLNAQMAEEETASKELAKYAKNNRMAARIKAKIKNIRDRLDVIRGLEQKKGGPLNLLKEIALAVPEDRLWLRSLEEKKGGSLTINGTAMDNDTVALFMTNLEKVKSITSVNLRSSQLRDFPKFKLKAAGFVLTCMTALHKEPSESGQKKKGSKRKR